MNGPGCGCGPGRPAGADLPDGPVGHVSAALRGMIEAGLRPIPAGFCEMGAARSLYPGDLDSPRRRVRLDRFRIGAEVVTNDLFARFVAESGYVTTAEREGWSFVFHLLLPAASRHPEHPPGLPWWRKVMGANWAHPEGPGSGIADRMDHPAVHVSWWDAQAFAAFTGTRLPHEAEWEHAARGGLRHRRFPWGDEAEPGGVHRHNVWQGRFPMENTAEDGYPGTAPAASFPPNGYGLHNMTGNVWEWVADWFGPLPEARLPPLRKPKGPADGTERVMRGGSFLCHDSYCARYHVHSRSRNAPDSTASHIGFRVAAD